MSLVGLFLPFVQGHPILQEILTYLPELSLTFILYAAIKMFRKVVVNWSSGFYYLLALGLVALVTPLSVWGLPILLLSAGSISVLLRSKTTCKSFSFKLLSKLEWQWGLFLLSLGGVWIVLDRLNNHPLIGLLASIYRYGYTVIGGGQVMIPMMITDLVDKQGLLSRAEFLSGYAIDQAVPGPLFSFAAFVSSLSFADYSAGLFIGILGGLLIFIPSTLLVFMMMPFWKKNLGRMKPSVIF